ncbi:hypothetical protein QVD17_20194 [Tagetes erecta]|uniref:Uncharacterized protein n=1 Tax=Tagetes erecta TaxID=13708 RepID=A0AAD8KLB2_TARER|nr:hypothetical protein QVD17_20194 [Tagetes erecta]
MWPKHNKKAKHIFFFILFAASTLLNNNLSIETINIPILVSPSILSLHKFNSHLQLNIHPLNFKFTVLVV